MNLKQSRYALISEALEKEETLTTKRMLFSTRKGMGITISNYVWSLIQAGNFTAIPDNLFNVLMYHELIVPEDEDELQELIIRNQTMSEDARGGELSVYLAPETSLDEQLRQSVCELISQNVTGGKKKLQAIVAAPSVAEGLRRIQWLDACVAAHPAGLLLQKEYQLVCTGVGSGAAQPAPFAGTLAATLSKVILVLNADQPGLGMQHVALELQKLQGPLQAQPPVPVEIQLLTSSGNPRLQGFLAEYQQLKHVLTAELLVQEVYTPGADEPLAEYQARELEWLNGLSNSKAILNLLPSPSFTYFNESKWRQAVTPSGALQLDYFPAETRLSTEIPSRNFYDTCFTDLLLAEQIRCATCIYLPMCGGRADKSDEHDLDCPSFVHNFMKKVEMKYNIVRS